MKRLTLVVLLLSAVSALCADDTKPSASPSTSSSPKSAFTDQKDKISYVIGVDIGRTLKRLQVPITQNILNQGINDVLGDKPIAMSDEELQSTLQAFQQQMVQKQQEAMAKKSEDMKGIADRNKADGKQFLEANSKKPGVKTTQSGLQYKVLKEGGGQKPTDTDVVETNYRGTLLDGKEFDSSAKNGGPVSFPVNGVIKGWSEALKMMPVGSKWQLYVPSELAYGDEGAGDEIAPGSTLVFDIELLGIKKDTGPATDHKSDASKPSSAASPSPTAP
ncbi:MAG: FKBP-type peptidyl-prolyl cis-trans isomerase [Verrucomicrobia bacterium]|nr:FKBP-type peptidyl-prolyl cis-trans isomerase [Verrucomicrobiota bacterium]